MTKKSVMSALSTLVLSRFAGFGGPDPLLPARRYTRVANCPVCSAPHKTGKEFCSSEHAREFRAERRHCLLPTKNGQWGRRTLAYRALRHLDSLSFTFPPGHHHKATVMANDLTAEADISPKDTGSVPFGAPFAEQANGRLLRTDWGA